MIGKERSNYEIAVNLYKATINCNIKFNCLQTKFIKRLLLNANQIAISTRMARQIGNMLNINFKLQN